MKLTRNKGIFMKRRIRESYIFVFSIYIFRPRIVFYKDTQGEAWEPRDGDQNTKHARSEQDLRQTIQEILVLGKSTSDHDDQQICQISGLDLREFMTHDIYIVCVSF